MRPQDLPGYSHVLSLFTCRIYRKRFRAVIGLCFVMQTHPRLRPYMRFLFVRPEICPLGDLLTPKIRLSSDSASRRTPLPLANPSHCRADSGLSPYRTCAHRAHTKNGQHLLDYRCCPLKICFDPFSDRMKESNFLILFVGCALLRLFKILAGRVHIGFHFPKLLRILPDGFELGIGFGMLLFQAGIRIFRNEKSCTRRFMIFILRQHRTMGAAGFGGSFAPNRAA